MAGLRRGPHDGMTDAATHRGGVNAAEDALEVYNGWSGLTRADGAAYYYDAIADILHAANKRGFRAGAIIASAESHFGAEGGRARTRRRTSTTRRSGIVRLTRTRRR